MPKTDEEKLLGLRRLCGYVENGTDTTVTIGQDDATRVWFVRVGPWGRPAKHFSGPSLFSALDAAIDGTPKEDWET